MGKLKYRALLNKYVSIHFKNYHDISNLNKEYKKRYAFWRSYLYSLDIIKTLPKNSKILDLGCGLGHDLYALKYLGFNNLTGVDISLENTKIVGKDKTLKIYNLSIEDFLTKASTKYDLVIFSDIIEHLKKDEALNILSGIYKVLNKKGILFIHTFNASFPYSSHVRYLDLTHETAYTKSSLSSLLHLSGFNDNHFFFVPSFNTWDSNIVIRLIRTYLVFSISKLFCFFHYMLSLSQGVKIDSFRPNLISISKKD